MYDPGAASFLGAHPRRRVCFQPASAASRQPPVPTPGSTSRRQAEQETGGPFPFGRIGLLPGGRFTAVGATLRELIRAAYGLREDAQITGGPNWVGADRFDVEAKAPADASPAQVQAMLKALLADRFKLTAHTESRQLPLYALVMARSDGKMGARLRRSGTECAPITHSGGARAGASSSASATGRSSASAGRPHADALRLDARGRHGVGSSDHDGAVHRSVVGLRRPPG